MPFSSCKNTEINISKVEYRIIAYQLSVLKWNDNETFFCLDRYISLTLADTFYLVD